MEGTVRERIYLLNEEQELELLYGTPFAQEDDLQRLIERHPELIDGEQIDPANPRRWILVAREVGIPDAPGAANRWSIDHLLIDQDAVPTLVEVKRSADTRIRREVVGQMLDYAAHASETWSIDDIRQFFEEGARDRGWNPETKLIDLLQPAGELDAGAFWDRVAANLQIKRLRLLFVADRIPDELKCIVEFLTSRCPESRCLPWNSCSIPALRPERLCHGYSAGTWPEALEVVEKAGRVRTSRRF